MLDKIDKYRVTWNGGKCPLGEFKANSGGTISLVLDGNNETRRPMTARKETVKSRVRPVVQNAHIITHISPLGYGANARGVRVGGSRREIDTLASKSHESIRR